MEGKSPFELVRDLQSQVGRLLSNFDVDSLRPAEREVFTSLKRQVVDLRLDIRDYGMAETKAEQDQRAAEARARLKAFEDNIVQAGSHNLFGAADVAQLSATTQQLMATL
jgi:hypothetical protein